MIFGYARVSTDSQSLSSQLDELRAAGCERIFREKISRATADRPQPRKLLAEVTDGDIVIVPAVDSLSRDTATCSPSPENRGATPKADSP